MSKYFYFDGDVLQHLSSLINNNALKGHSGSFGLVQLFNKLDFISDGILKTGNVYAISA